MTCGTQVPDDNEQEEEVDHWPGHGQGRMSGRIRAAINKNKIG